MRYCRDEEWPSTLFQRLCHSIVVENVKYTVSSWSQEAPLKIAIRGGTDTPLGGQILISRILEGGAAEKYGQCL